MPSSSTHVLANLRRARRLSQLDLGLAAEVSARHISFIETGRSQPSRTLLLRIADVMGLCHREANQLMCACGYAPAFSTMPLEEDAMRPVQEALATMLDNHNPYPATVLNHTWEVRMANTSMQRLLALLLGAPLRAAPINMLKLVFSHEGLRPFIVNWDELAGLLLRRLKLELQTHPENDNALLFAELLNMHPPANWQTPPSHWEGPMLTAQVRVGTQELSLFTTLTSFGTPLDAGLQELMIESYFPADDSTRRFFNDPAFTQISTSDTGYGLNE